jgi:hypothetical protein
MQTGMVRNSGAPKRTRIPVYLNFAQTNGNLLMGEDGSQTSLNEPGKGIGSIQNDFADVFLFVECYKASDP